MPLNNKLWPTINARRGQLINKQYASGLTTEEAEELVTLQEYADEYLSQFALPRLEALQAQIDRAFVLIMRSELAAIYDCPYCGSLSRVSFIEWHEARGHRKYKITRCLDCQRDERVYPTQ